MPLDVTVMGVDGRPERSVPISVDQHAALMLKLPASGESLLRRLEDYYEDASFAVDELPTLENDIRDAASRCTDSKQLTEVLREMSALVRLARRQGRPVEALAD